MAATSDMADTSCPVAAQRRNPFAEWKMASDARPTAQSTIGAREGVHTFFTNPGLRPMRTAEQKRADEFDLKLFRLISDAEHTPSSKPSARPSAQWIKVGQMLREARVLVRSMMHDDDRWQTL